jgi:hypothetical protein
MTGAWFSSAEQRAAYRRWIREHHPDRGGDPDAFAAGLARYQAILREDRCGTHQDRYDAPIVIVPDSDHLRRDLRRLWRRLRRRPSMRVR